MNIDESKKIDELYHLKRQVKAAIDDCLMGLAIIRDRRLELDEMMWQLEDKVDKIKEQFKDLVG